MPFNYSLPQDAIAGTAVALGLVLVLVAWKQATSAASSRRLFVFLATSASALLSAGYIVAYLRGGPRIIDATTYYLQARAFADGDLAWQVGEPASRVAGRFLVRDTLADGNQIGGIFPPGYPAVLALGFWLGAPLAVGPALAALLTLAIAWLADAALPSDLPSRERVLRVIVLLSVVSGCLRYHTADTMSHGLSCLLLCVALAAGLRWSVRGGLVYALMVGAAFGLLLATRPVTAVACAAVLLLLVLRSRPSAKPTKLYSVLVLLVGIAPGALLLLLHQRAVTGRLFQSSQLHYYANSDGPAGCFRYGFGQDIGCLNEHGDFVRHNLPNGYGLVAAVKTTARRLLLHVQDPLNDELLGLLLLIGVAIAAVRFARMRPIALLPIVLVLAYSPFYFDGNYPGGGARFFSEALPCELICGVVGLAELGRRWPLGERLVRALPALSLLLFGLNAHSDHELLRDREGGRPMFLQEDVAQLRAPALVFIDTDHGFGLAFRPGARAAEGELEFARYRGDLSDELTLQAAAKVPAFLHHYDAQTGLVELQPFRSHNVTSLCSSSLWPPLAQRRGFIATEASPNPSCPFALSVRSNQSGSEFEFELPQGLLGQRVAPVVRSTEESWELVISQADEVLARWDAKALASESLTSQAVLLERHVSAPLKLTMRHISDAPPKIAPTLVSLEVL